MECEELQCSSKEPENRPISDDMENKPNFIN